MALPSAEASAPPAAEAKPQEASAATSAEISSAGAASTSAQVTDSAAVATGTLPTRTETVTHPGVVGATEEGKTATPIYHAVTTGQPVDPGAVQAAAIAQQHAMYSGFGSPYAAPGAMRQQYMAGGYPMYSPAAAAPAGPAPLYTMKVPTLPGPCYYDPYGMLNPVACIAPMRMAPGDEHANTKLLAPKKQNRWCC